jgi:hypothetical protein
MTFEWQGEILEGDSADKHAQKFRIVSMGGQAEGLACADPGTRTPIGASGNFSVFLQFCFNIKQPLNEARGTRH